MKVLLVLCVSIVPFIYAQEQIKLERNRGGVVLGTDLQGILAGLNQQQSRPSPKVKQTINSIPLTAKKNPWLTPTEGILVNEHTRVYYAKRGRDGEVSFDEIQRVMVDVGLPALRNQRYQNASLENINNPDHVSIVPIAPASTIGEWPQILYPELMVVVAHDLYEKLGSNLADVIPYLLAFWNGVDTLFRSIENPKIRLNIAKIVIEEEAGVLDYLKSSSIDPKYLDRAAQGMSQFFWQNHKNQMPLDGYDMAVTMTTRATCTTSSSCDQIALGTSKVGSMCKDTSLQFIPEKMMNIADDGKFSGLIPTAHELGHSLGMEHDQTMMKYSDEELKDTPSCRNVPVNHIMDDNSGADEHTPYRRRWSKCSLEQLENFIMKSNPTCLYNPPRTGDIHFPRLLPGQLVTLDDLCQSRGYTKAFPIQSIPCIWPYCMKHGDEGTGYLMRTIHPAEGSRCDPKDPTKFCLFGNCFSPSDFK